MWQWVAIAYLAMIPVAAFGFGWLDEKSMDDGSHARVPDPVIWLISIFWIVLLAAFLPYLGREVYKERKERRERYDAKEERIEAEMRVVRAERARSAPYRAKGKRFLDLRR